MSAALPETLAQSLRQHDRDRYLTTLLAPATRRGDLTALYAFNFEVAKTREIVREPLLGRIRLQWWREAIDEIYRGQTPRKHEVVEPLAAAIRCHDLTRYHFDRLIDAREGDLADEPPASLAALESYAEDTAARLVRLALEILGARNDISGEAGRRVGIAWALIGTIRALPVQARLRRLSLPADLIAESGLDVAPFLELKSSPALSRIVERLAERAHEHLVASRAELKAIPREAHAALLPAVLGDWHLKRLARQRYDPFAPALAQGDTLASWRLALAAWRGRF
ncbi:MAG TPA: phytoene/squalene synthase family protein [Stellaceae bacterium]|nr:phytoene/squalene synthase family protein [Stellaceae bacterium]